MPFSKRFPEKKLQIVTESSTVPSSTTGESDTVDFGNNSQQDTTSTQTLQSFLNAGLVKTLEKLDWNPEIISTLNHNSNQTDPTETTQNQNYTFQAVDAGKFVLTISNDHSFVINTLEAVQLKYPEACVIWVDGCVDDIQANKYTTISKANSASSSTTDLVSESTLASETTEPSDIPPNSSFSILEYMLANIHPSRIAHITLRGPTSSSKKLSKPFVANSSLTSRSVSHSVSRIDSSSTLCSTLSNISTLKSSTDLLLDSHTTSYPNLHTTHLTLFKNHNIPTFTTHHVDKLGISKVMQSVLQCINPYNTRPVHLVFGLGAVDLGLDLDYAKGASSGLGEGRNLVHGGLTWREACYICESVAETGNLVAMDLITPKLLPSTNSSFENIGACSEYANLEKKNEGNQKLVTSYGLGLIKSALGDVLL